MFRLPASSILAIMLAMTAPARGQIPSIPPPSIPPPSGAPQGIRAETDPFLTALAARPGSPTFTDSIAAAAAALPVLGERGADVAVAEAQRDQSRSRLFPTLGVDAVAARTIARDFELSTTQQIGRASCRERVLMPV